MEVLGDISTLISLGQTVEGIFDSGPTPPTLQDIEGALVKEVSAVFFGEEAAAEVTSAAGTLQTVQDFFAIDYVNAKKTGGDLWSLLNSGSVTSLSDLDQVAQTVRGWLAASDDQAAPKDMISQACSICLGVYLHICLLHRARADTAPKQGDPVPAGDPPGNPAGEVLDLQSYALEAVQKMQARVMVRIAGRIASAVLSEEMVGDFPVPRRLEVKIVDSWFDGGSNFLLSSAPPGTAGWDPPTVVARVLRAYRRLLWSGADADYNEFLAVLNDPTMGENLSVTVYYGARTSFITNSLPGALAFGKWAASARRVLMSLDTMVTGFSTPQDDWHCCSKCGGLYFETGAPDDGTKRCPTGSQHSGINSGNYVIHSVTDPAATPAGTQPDWCYCAACHVLFYKGSRPRVCPAGGAHDTGTGTNYFLAVGDAPAQIAITVEQGWHFCGNCSVLHSYQNSTSVCPGNGGLQHQMAGSGNYWLSNLGAGSGV
jgi:hypothetical protein